ncbi:iron reductase [Gordonia sp. CPCC 205515]|uniref:iron reductase n=1 Tax=Gordonia sp. CPCC 205515 TaxID=3140791 RepID=UPI003AF370A8
MNSEWLWYVSRASGIVTLLLFTVVLLLGIAGVGTKRARMSATVTVTHRGLALASLVFLACHVLTAVLDTYVDVGWLVPFVPFASGYERFGVALGTVALDIGLTIIVTSLLRHRIPEHAWRLVHWSAYGMALFAVTHSLIMSRSDQPVITTASITCAVVLAVTGLLRIWHIRTTSRTRRIELIQEWT